MATATQNRPDEDVDPIQSAYDQEFNRMTSPENYAESAPDPTTSDVRDAEEGGSLFNPSGDAARTPKSPAAGIGDAASNLAQDGLFNAAETAGGALAPPLALALRVGSLIARNRRKSAAGGVAGIIITIVVVLGGGGLLSMELIHIEKALLGDVAKIEQRAEKKIAQKLAQQIVKRLVKKATGTAEEKAAIAADEAAGGEMTKAMDEFKITDPQVVESLGNAGITVEVNSAGEFTGLRDAASGADITNEIGTSEELFGKIEEALPEWNVGQIEEFRPLMVDHAEASFEALPEGTEPKDVKSVIENEVKNGATEADLSSVAEERATESETGAPDDPNKPTAAESAASQTAQSEGGALGDLLDTTSGEIAKGASPDAAIADAAGKFDLGSPLLASSIATTLCNFSNGVKDASNNRVPKITKLLIRHETLLVAMADEIKSGKIKSADVKKVMEVFNGDPTAKRTSSNPHPEAALPFTSSAAWQRIVKNPVNGNKKSSAYTPDISKSSLPTKSSGTKIVDELTTIEKDTGLTFGCKALTSKFGFIVQGGLGIFQLVADAGSFGTTQIAITGGILAAQESLQRFVLPEVIKYFLPIGVSGAEDSVQWMNNAHVGGILAYGDYGRRMGAQPMSKAQTRKLVAAANADELKHIAAMPWTERTFGSDNPDSLTSKLAVSIPITTQNIATNAADLFTSLPGTIMHTFSSILFYARAGADPTDSATDPEQQYGVTQYALTDEVISTYPDGVANEKYLMGNVTYKDKDGVVHKATRLSMTGDPNKFEGQSNDDSDTSDILHCFVNGFADDGNTADSPANRNDPDAICGSLGSFDMSSLEPTPITDGTVANVYCQHLAGAATPECLQQVTPQLHDDIGHFQAYIAWVHVMHSYSSLAAKS